MKRTQSSENGQNVLMRYGRRGQWVKVTRISSLSETGLILWTVKEAATVLTCSRLWIMRAIQRGELEAWLYGSRWFVRAEHILRLAQVREERQRELSLATR
jgi:excisionase family DNA binding protein